MVELCSQRTVLRKGPGNMKTSTFWRNIFLENRKRIQNNFFIHMLNLIIKIVIVGV